MTATIYPGDCLATLQSLPDGRARCCVTSPPYFGLRDYGTGKWEGGDAECDHREVGPQNRPGRETPGGRGGTFPTTERGFRQLCSKCGARRIDDQLGLEAIHHGHYRLSDTPRLSAAVAHCGITRNWFSLGDP